MTKPTRLRAISRAANWRRRALVLLHVALVAGLWALWFRFQTSVRASPVYDRLFDGLTIKIVAAEVGFVTLAILVTLVIWWRTGLRLPVTLVDLAVAVTLGGMAATMLAERGSLTVGRWLAVVVGAVAAVSAVVVWRQDAPRPTSAVLPRRAETPERGNAPQVPGAR